MQNLTFLSIAHLYQYTNERMHNLPPFLVFWGSLASSFMGKNTLHLQPYHLFGFCLDCYTETQNSLDRSKLRPSQTPINHPSEFFGHITFSVPNIKLQKMKSESCCKLYNIQSKNSIMIIWSVITMHCPDGSRWGGPGKGCTDFVYSIV